MGLAYGAEEKFKRALEINSNYAPAHQFYADYLKAMGRFDEALAEMSRAQALDPLSLSINAGIGHVLHLSRQYDRALEQYEKTIKIDPTFLPSRLWYGRPLLQKGMYKEAIAELAEAVKLSRNSIVSLAMLGQAHGASGQEGNGGYFGGTQQAVSNGIRRIVLDSHDIRRERRQGPSFHMV